MSTKSKKKEACRKIFYDETQVGDIPVSQLDQFHERVGVGTQNSIVAQSMPSGKEKCSIVWELRVVGWEVSYGAEFLPTAEDRYTVIIQKATKKAPSDEPVVSNSFKVGELGEILLTPNLKKEAACLQVQDQVLHRPRISSKH